MILKNNSRAMELSAGSARKYQTQMQLKTTARYPSTTPPQLGFTNKEAT